MTPVELRRRLRAGERLFGTLIVSPSPRWPDAVRDCGLDFVFLDTEHVALDRSQLSWMCQAYAAIGLPPIVRIPSPDPFAATMVLDGGAAGVVAPYVETVEQVKALQGAVKLRPIKGQRLQGLLDAAGTSPGLEPELDSYLRRSAEANLMVINVESVPALDNLDSLLAVPGLDGVLIGPHDLSCSLGLPEQYDHPRFLAACERIFRRARAAGVGAGIHFWGEPEQQRRFLDMGANLLIHSGDIMLFRKHLSADLRAMRQTAGLAAEVAADPATVTI
jgi:2-keto-3-deoxy-L-rhamnonate aldolase RhmA